MKAPEVDIPHGNEVTTEPQKQALEAMSNELVQKLNAMVAEQERRAHAFAAQQHSLSSLPTYSLPEVTAPQLPEAPLPPEPQPTSYRPEAPAPQPQQPTYQAPLPPSAAFRRKVEAPGPNLPQVPPPPPADSNKPPQTYFNTNSWGTLPTPPRKAPTIIRDTQSEQKEGSIGAGTIATILIIIFILILQGC